MTSRDASETMDRNGLEGPTIGHVSTFWHGSPLSALDLACLRSFVAAGYQVRVYSYEPIGDLPAGIHAADAREVADERFLDAFIVKGKPSITHFSDLFRYRLFLATGSTWIDADLVCLPGKRLPDGPSLFGRETPRGLNNAVMRVSSSNPMLPVLIEKAERLAGRAMPWGATGPRLMTSVLGSEIITSAPPPSVFYPVHWDEWFMPFLPSFRDRCETQCAGATTLHLWNNVIERSGYWKELAPPEGSYLHARFEELGLLPGFKDVYPEKVMLRVFETWLHSMTGERLGPTAIARVIASRVLRDRHKPLVRKFRAFQARRLLPEERTTHQA